MPEVAEGMNNLPKIVFSRTLDKVSWNNTTLMKSDLIGEVEKMKSQPGPDITILGSGSIVSQLSEHGLLDEYQIVLVPVVLGTGRTMFDGLGRRLPMKQTKTQTFDNGNVLLCYESQR